MTAVAVAAPARKKCNYGAKCYRKNKQHLKDFWHPGDGVDDDDNEDITDKDDSPAKTKAVDKPRLVHDISVNDDEDEEMPLAGKAPANPRKRKSDDDKGDAKADDGSKTAPSTSKAEPPAKKVKFDDSNVEKITVDYTKVKAKASKNDAQASSSSTSTVSTTGTTKQAAEPPKPIQYSSKKEKCKYWDKCYQTNEKHLEDYYHPGDDMPKDDDDDKGKKTRGQTITPANPLEDGGSVQFDSGYTLKRDGDIYSCSCKGFMVQRAPINERTCKHLKEYNGEEFEKSRTSANAKPKPSYIKQHINVNLLLAHKYDEKVNNPIGWWISEKLDGVRAFWNGRCFYSRLGNAFYAPEWFTKDLPKDMHLDGELFGGRGQFQSTVSIVKTAESPKWKDIKYYVFDSPHMGQDQFEKRMNTIKDYFEEVQPEYAVFVDQTKCVSKVQLDQMLTRILNIGGEGLMIRQPKSVYEATRSRTLLKIKKFYDAEAIVIAHEKGKGVNQHRCGALRCRMACGKEFSVGSGLTDKDRNRPPKIGSIITYKFQELSKSGSPRFPTYVGIRIDMTEPKDAEIRQIMDEDEA